MADAEITPEALYDALEANEPLWILDVRAPERLLSARIDLAPPERFRNVRGSEVTSMADPAAAGLDPSVSWVVVCGHGNDSRRIASHLAARGYRARSLRGGIVGWMLAVKPRELRPPPALDRVVQFDRFGKGALGYLLVSGDEALVIDAPREWGAYVAAAESSRARIVGVADTHCHADYISGGPILARELKVPYHLHPADAVSPYDGRPGRIAYQPLADGRRLRVGRAEIEALHTPGHTEGSVTFTAGAAAFTGDFLFVSNVGRPDLGGKTEEWSRVLWRSLERVRRRWPGEMEVYPAHYGSDAERRPDRTVGGRFEEMLRRNEPLSLRSEEPFLAWVRRKAGRFPDAYRSIKAVNLGLEAVDRTGAETLEAGRNECALG